MTKTGSKSKKMNKKWDDDQISTFIVPKGHVAWDYCKRWPRDLTQPLIPYQTSCVCSVLVLVFLLMCTLAVFSQIVNALVSTSFKCLASLRGWINVFATIYNSLMHLRGKKLPLKCPVWTIHYVSLMSSKPFKSDVRDDVWF